MHMVLRTVDKFKDFYDRGGVNEHASGYFNRNFMHNRISLSAMPHAIILFTHFVISLPVSCMINNLYFFHGRLRSDISLDN